MDNGTRNGGNRAGAFKTVQDALKFYPTDKSVEIIN